MASHHRIILSPLAVVLPSLLLVTGCGDPVVEPPTTTPSSETGAAPNTPPTPTTPTTPPAASASTPEAAPAEPIADHGTLAFVDPIVDFGRLADFEKREAVVAFRNAGGGDLQITKVQPTCGCTSIGFDTSRIYAPGETGEIRLAFSPKGQGKQTKIVNVMSDDPDEPIRRITIKADIISSLSAEPRVLQLGRFPFGETFDTGTTVTALRPGIDLVRAKISGDLAPHARVSLEPTGTDSAGRKTWWVDVTLEETVPWGWRSGNIVVSGAANTDDGVKAVSMNFAINGSAEGILEADESMFRLLAVDPGSEIDHSVTVRRTDGRPFQCQPTAIDGDRLSGLFADARPLDSSRNAWVITLKGRAPSTPGSLIGRLPLITDVPGEEEISIRIGGVVRQ